MDTVEAIRSVVERACREANEGCCSAEDDQGWEYFAMKFREQDRGRPCRESGEHFVVSVGRRGDGVWPVDECDAVDAGYLLCSMFLRQAHPCGRVIRRLS
jgi:hypothetical protein